MRQPTVRVWSIFFNKTFKISYSELDKHVGLLRINIGTIKKKFIFTGATPNKKVDFGVKTIAPPPLKPAIIFSFNEGYKKIHSLMYFNLLDI